jgi:hypothetical protein
MLDDGLFDVRVFLHYGRTTSVSTSNVDWRAVSKERPAAR